MLKRVMAMLTSKYLAIKAKMRAIETRLIIHSLLLRDKKTFLHFLHKRTYFNMPNKVEDDTITALTDDSSDEDDTEAYNEYTPSDKVAALMSNSTPVSIMQLEEDKTGEEDEGDGGYSNFRYSPLKDEYPNFKYPPLKDDLDDDEYPNFKHSPLKDYQDDDEYPNFRHLPLKDDQIGDRPLSAIEMVKKAKEGQGKEFRLEDDIDQVADLFIQRFHNQIRLQKFNHESPL